MAKSSASDKKAYHIYTDGSVRPGGAAACACVILKPDRKSVVRIESKPFRGMTINQMELMAIELALDDPKLEHVIFYSDSAYAIMCLTVWHYNWAKNNWITPLKEPVKNKEIIQRILAKIKTKKSFSIRKVKAHSGDPYNTLVDFHATQLTAKMVLDPLLDRGVILT